MNALLLWILGILGVLSLLWGLTRLPRGGLAWMGFGLVLGLAGLGGAWLHQQYGTAVFWGLGLLGVLLLVWALLNLRSRLASWSAGLAVLLALTGFGSIVLLNSSSPNLLTSGTIPNPLNSFQTDPATPPGSAPDNPATTPTLPTETAPEPTPTPSETGPSQPTTEPPPSPAEPGPALPAPTPPVTSGSVREIEPACPCLLNVSVNVPNPTTRILQGATEIASSRLGRSSFLLEAGDYTLQVEAPGYRTFSALINVPRNKNLEVELVQ
ncbi:PEGA domain-containing protein [Meiothermus sp.]|uniref:PEGA domain-containing protein n=1 Tax=Meiothermus sp. TaxID=1955249 RepID=UPI00307F08D8